MHTVTDAYTARGLELKRKTALEWAGPCPVCGGTDRFTVFVEQDGGALWDAILGRGGKRPVSEGGAASPEEYYTYNPSHSKDVN